MYSISNVTCLLKNVQEFGEALGYKIETFAIENLIEVVWSKTGE